LKGLLFHLRSPPQPSPEVNNQICRYYKFLGFYGSVTEIHFFWNVISWKWVKFAKHSETIQLSHFQGKIFFDISNLEDDPTVFSLNNGDWFPKHVPSDIRRAESFMDSFEIEV
jgi:hypothetical protein